MTTHDWSSRAPRRAASRTSAVGATIVGVALALVQAAVPPAANAAPACTTTGLNTTCTFEFTGGAQTWVVPAGVTSATFHLFGAQGSNGANSFYGVQGGRGGPGGETTATLPVTPGQTVEVNVGGQGSFGVPGFNGGGGVGGHCADGGGGGATDVRTGAFGLADRIVVACGGGGGGGAAGGCLGASNGGAGGGSTGLAGATVSGTVYPSSVTVVGGEPGTQSNGGAGGYSDCFPNGVGDSGTFGQGGNSGVGGGGGGGGGYYGGGGGGGCYFQSGGGGGSGYIPASASNASFNTGVQQGNGKVVIAYTVAADMTAPITTIKSHPSDPTNASGASFTLQATDPDDAATGLVFSCSLDGGATAACTSPASYTSLGDGTHTFKAHATDAAGNNGSDAGFTWLVDTVPPTVSAASTTLPNANGWYNGPVTVHFTCLDGGSGIAAGTCPADQVLTAQGSAASSTPQTVVDLAGNTGGPSNVVTVAIDETPPTLNGAATTLPNANGWYKGDVTIAWNCADGLSGVGACPTNSSITGEGLGLSASASVTDKAGNTTLASSGGVNIDRTAPTLAPSVSSNQVLLGGTASASPNATDALAGVAAQSCGSVDTSAVGTHSVTCSATDRAGNTATRTASYAVVYDQKLVYNTTTLYKSGASIPIAVQLRDAAGKNVSSATIPVTAVAVVNSSGTVVKTINASFKFAKGQAEYTYSLATKGLASGSYTLRFGAGSDPTTHSAPFSIK